MREKNVTAKFKELKKNAWSGIWAKRILSELQYLLELQDFLSAKQNELVQGAVEKLWFCTKEQGAITKDAVLALEKDLEPVKETARSLTVLVVGAGAGEGSGACKGNGQVSDGAGGGPRAYRYELDVGFSGDCVRDGGYL